MQVDFVVFLVLICSVLLPVSKPKWPIKYESFRVYLRLQKSKTCQAWGGGGLRGERVQWDQTGEQKAGREND